jgi:glycosyltransferase involved in cell wall biosynthesis
MAQSGTRLNQSVLGTHKGYYLVLTRGRVYGIPDFLDLDEVHSRSLFTSYPAILSAATADEVKAAIDALEPGFLRREPAGTCEGYDLIRYRGSYYAVPPGAGPVDLNLEDDCWDAGVIRGATCEAVRRQILGARDKTPVEFAGWMPVYDATGNCGRHPQFKHTAEPPPGYRFTRSAPPKKYGLPPWCKPIYRLAVSLGRCLGLFLVTLWILIRPLFGSFLGGRRCSLRGRVRVLAALARLYLTLRRNGGRLVPVLRFLRSRHYRSQVLLADYRGLVFLTTVPYTYGQNPWVIEIEDPTTLFLPFFANGRTRDLDLRASPYFPLVKALLEADACKGIITHMKSTAEIVPAFFESETIRDKVFHVPLGVDLPARWQRHEEAEHVNLLFINSWHQMPENFALRGGLDVLEAFATLHERYPQLRLTLRTTLPPLDRHYHRIIESGWVRVIDRFLPADEMQALLAESHVFLLPAARIHVVSLLQAMAAGLAVVASDGWGIGEYVRHEHNGLIVKGRYGKVSWVDDQAGMLREYYRPMLTADAEVVEGLVEAVSRLVEDRALRKRLGHGARRDVETTYSLERWNQGLRAVFDRALGAAPPAHEAARAGAIPSLSLSSARPRSAECTSSVNTPPRRTSSS